MNDRELTWYAGRSMGYDRMGVQHGDKRWITDYEGFFFDPLEDGGNAFDLLNYHNMTAMREDSRRGWSVGAVVGGEYRSFFDKDLKRAVTLVAAEIGRRMQ